MDISKLQNKLPVMRHFDSNELVSGVNSFKKGEKGIYNIMKLVIFGTIIYFSYIYVFPVVFQAIGKVLAIAGTAIILLFLALAFPVILKGIRLLTKHIHKAIIRVDPFQPLYEQFSKMKLNLENFIKSRSKIRKLREQMEIGARESEEKAVKLSDKILNSEKKAIQCKQEMENLVAKLGPNAKQEDAYVEAMVKYQKLISDGQRTAHLFTQEKSFISKYGTRANIMKKLEHKLILVGTAMAIKIDDFEVTIDILEKDYAFAKETKEATSAAKSAMLFTTDWEFDYAMDVVTSTISEDIAISTANIADIDKYTSEYSLDSDELFDNLSKVAGEIRVGDDPIPSASAYTQEDYKLTQTDRENSGGFPTLF